MELMYSSLCQGKTSDVCVNLMVSINRQQQCLNGSNYLFRNIDILYRKKTLNLIIHSQTIKNYTHTQRLHQLLDFAESAGIYHGLRVINKGNGFIISLRSPIRAVTFYQKFKHLLQHGETLNFNDPLQFTIYIPKALEIHRLFPPKKLHQIFFYPLLFC